MKILVTGGAGFIGSTIVRKAVAKGYDVVVLDNLSTGHEENLAGLKLKFVNGDILNSALVKQIAEDVDCIYHLAASVGNIRSIEQPDADVQNNYIGTLNVLEAAKINKVKHVIYSSTAAGYGEPKHLPIDEEHPFNPDSPYGVTKIAGEKLALCYGRLFGFKVTCLRYFNAYGVNQRYDAYGNVIPIFANKILKDTPITIYGDGNQTRDFINAEDIADANLAVLEKNIVGYYNIATGQGTTINRLVEILVQVSGRKPTINYADFRKGEVKHSVASIEKAASAFQYSPTVSLSEGLEKYWHWYFPTFKNA